MRVPASSRRKCCAARNPAICRSSLSRSLIGLAGALERSADLEVFPTPKCSAIHANEGVEFRWRAAKAILRNEVGSQPLDFIGAPERNFEPLTPRSCSLVLYPAELPVPGEPSRARPAAWSGRRVGAIRDGAPLLMVAAGESKDLSALGPRLCQPGSGRADWTGPAPAIIVRWGEQACPPWPSLQPTPSSPTTSRRGVLASGIRAEAVGPETASLRIPFSEQLCRVGGILCGQALLTGADTAMVIARLPRAAASSPAPPSISPSITCAPSPGRTRCWKRR